MGLKLPSWVPQTPRPSSMCGWDKVWDAMTKEERQWSFLFFDLPVIVVCFGLMIYGVS